jgi:hypothetical protein
MRRRYELEGKTRFRVQIQYFTAFGSLESDWSVRLKEELVGPSRSQLNIGPWSEE